MGYGWWIHGWWTRFDGARRPRPRWIARPAGCALPVALTALLLLTAACAGPGGGASTGTRGQTASGAPTPTLAATSNPDNSGPTTAQVCKASGGSKLTVTSTHVGVVNEQFERLPDALTQQPQAVPHSLGSVSVDNHVGIGIQMSQPPKSSPGYVCGVTVRVLAFTPLVGTVSNVYHACDDSAYIIPTGPSPGDCGAMAGPNGEGPVVLGSSAVGTSATAAVTDPLANSTLQPATEPAAPFSNPQIWVLIEVPAAGTYSFDIRLWQDKSGPSISLPTVSDTFLLLHAAHEWSGQACTTPDMQAKLPAATNPPTPLICPGPPPQP